MLRDASDFSPEDQEKIRRAKLEWEHTFDAVPDLIFITDTACSIIRANRALANWCNCSPVELIGRKCFEIFHGTESPPAFCPHNRLLDLQESQTTVCETENPHGVFEVIISPVFNADGQVESCVHVARDITEKRRHEELLEAQQKKLEDINNSLESRVVAAVAELRRKDDILIQQSRLNALGEMISNIAHQWRQPLNNIGLIVQNLQLAYKANDLGAEELEKEVADIMSVLQHMSDTINDFCDFFSCGEDCSTFSVNTVLFRLLAFAGPALKRKGIIVVLDEEPGITADGYPNEYAQAVLNVLMNAGDAALEHHVNEPHIYVRIFGENGRSVVTVRDNGGGISEEILPKIYDPYFTTKHRQKSAGIGLYMAKTIIEKKMHGCLSARNVDGGAEFRIEL